jgi:transcriptional regulator with XRE-family HTH domain
MNAQTFLNTLIPERPLHRVYKTELLFKISSMILDLRINKDMSQKQLADLFNVTQGMISKWESAKYNFTVEQICKISEKLNVKPTIGFINSTDILAGNVWKDSFENKAFSNDVENDIPLSA